MNVVSGSAAAGGGLVRDRVTWYAYLALAYQTYVISMQGNILPFLKTELGLTYGEVSLHTSAVAVGAFVAGFGGEYVIRRLRRARTLTLSLCGAAIGALLLALAGAAWQSVAACLVIGLFSAFIPAMVNAILFDIHGPRRDLAYAESNAICYAFAIVVPLVTSLATAMHWNWRVAILLGVAVGLVIAVVFRRTPVPDNKRARESDGTPLPAAYWAYFTMLGLAVAIEFAAILWAPSYFEKVVGLSTPVAAAAASAFFAAVLIGRSSGAFIFRLFPRPAIYFGAAILVLVGFAAYWGGTRWPVVAVAGLFVIGLGVSNLFALIIGFAMDMAGAASDRASARAIVAPGVAILASPPLLGTFADTAGLHAAQVMIPTYVVLATLVFFLAQSLERRAR
jgi:fucose permease